MLSLTVLPETCFKIKITLSLHCSESPSGQEKRLSPQQEITVKLKDKNMTSWPSAFFLHSHLPLFNLHTSITFTFPPSLLFFLFCLLPFMSASRRIIRLHCSSPPLFFHTLLIISVALSLFHCGIRALQRRQDV